jgi:alkaline phosphatase
MNLTRPTFPLLLILALLALLAGALSPGPSQATTAARYVILFQGDGMAPMHIRAGADYVCGAQPCLAFETFPHSTTMTHNNASGGTTDSAASATAMSTGVKVDNGVISVRLPGDGAELRTQLEIYRDRGFSTGLVTQSTMTDASPAARGAHNPSRNNTADINADYLTQTRPNVLLGGGGAGFDTAQAASLGWTVVADRSALLAANTGSLTRLAGGFGSGMIPPVGYPGRPTALPTLPEMTQQALRVLDNDPDGFYVFIEHEGIDEYSHGNDATNMVRSMAELSNAVQAAIDWVNDPGNAADWTNTLIVVVGDHETGGITSVVNNGAGNVPSITWTTTGHTQTPVAVYARGAGADQITGVQIDNTGIFGLLNPAGPDNTPTPGSTPTPDPALTAAFQDGVAPNPGYAGTADAYLSQANPAGNFGNAAVLLIDGDDPAGSGNDLSTLLRWDVSAIPPGSTVRAASITLNVLNVSSGGYPVYEVKRPWVESGASWSAYATGAAWEVAGAMGAADRGTAVLGTVAPGGLGLSTFSLNAAGVALVQSWVDGSAGNRGLIIASPGITDGADFDSSEATVAANRPKLTVKYLPPSATPEPTLTPTSTPVPTDTPTSTPVPTDTPTATPAPTDTPTFTPVPTSRPTFTPAPTDTPTNTPEPLVVHVSDLDGSSSVQKKSWSANVTITVHDANHAAVSNATVGGAWSGTRVSGSDSCTTGAGGQCTVTKANLKLTTTGVTFTVSGVTKAGYVYAAAANHDPDGDSTGTLIVVRQ